MLVAALVASVPSAMWAEEVIDGVFSYELNDETHTATLTGFDDTVTVAEIPDAITVNGEQYPVTVIASSAITYKYVEKVVLGANITEIGDYGLASNGYLTEVVLNDNLEKIGYRAFYNAPITSIELPATLRSIGGDAFFNCSELAYAVIPPALEELGSGAFRNTSLAGEVSIPATLTSIGTGVWRGTTVSNFVVAPENPEYLSQDGIIFTKDMEKLLAFPIGSPLESYTVPATVKEICTQSMRNLVNVKTIMLQEGLEAIGANALCANIITSLTIPASVQEIGSGALFANSELETLEVAAGNPRYESIDGYLIESASDKIIASINRTGTLTIPEGVKEIGDYAFYGSNDVEKVVFPSSLESVGDVAFYASQNLKEVDLGTGVTVLGEMCFQDCGMLDKVEFPSQLREIKDQAFLETKMTNVILNDGLEKIGSAAFYHTQVKKTYLPASVKEIGGGMFEGCEKLEEVELQDGCTQLPELFLNMCHSVRSIDLPESIVYIGASALYETPITELTLPQGLKEIGEMAIYGTNLTELEIPDAVEKIGEFAFAWSPYLKHIKFGKGLKKLEDFTIHGCHALENVELNEGLEEMGYCSLSLCDNLRNLTIPSTVTTIADGAFQWVAFDEIVNCATTPQEITDETFFDGDYQPIYDSCILVVPDGCEEVYRNAPIWQKFYKIETVGVSETASGDAEVIEIFDINGLHRSSIGEGVNILRMSDGSTRKVMGRK